MDRKEFLLKSTAFAAGTIILPSACASSTGSKASIAPGLQVYTIREAIAEDFEGSLKRVADLGFSNIELFAYSNGEYFGHSIAEVKSIMNDLGLMPKSSHVLTGRAGPDMPSTMTNGWEQTVEDAAELGQEYIICAYLMDPERESLDDYKEVAELLNKCGEVAKAAGLQMGYHNHAFEFDMIDETVPFDILLEECDDELVEFELDLYWTRRAGIDPIAYFEKYPGRFPLWHVKDMEAGEEQFFAAVGEGVIDWQNIFDHSETAGLEYYFVEQDQTRNDNPFEEIAKSKTYLEGINI